MRQGFARPQPHRFRFGGRVTPFITQFSERGVRYRGTETSVEFEVDADDSACAWRSADPGGWLLLRWRALVWRGALRRWLSRARGWSGATR